MQPAKNSDIKANTLSGTLSERTDEDLLNIDVPKKAKVQIYIKHLNDKVIEHSSPGPKPTVRIKPLLQMSTQMKAQ